MPKFGLNLKLLLLSAVLLVLMFVVFIQSKSNIVLLEKEVSVLNSKFEDNSDTMVNKYNESIGSLTAIITELEADIGKIQKEIESSEATISSELTSQKANQEAALKKLAAIDKVSNSFSQFHYWISNLSASWQDQSLDNVEKFALDVSNNLEALNINSFAEDESNKIANHINLMEELSIESVDAFMVENRVEGNILMIKINEEAKSVFSILRTLSSKQTERLSPVDISSPGYSSLLNGLSFSYSTPLSVELSAGEQNSLVTKSYNLFILIAAFVIAIVLSLLISGSYSKQVNEIACAIKERISGDFANTIPTFKSELGKITSELELWKEPVPDIVLPTQEIHKSLTQEAANNNDVEAFPPSSEI